MYRLYNLSYSHPAHFDLEPGHNTFYLSRALKFAQQCSTETTDGSGSPLRFECHRWQHTNVLLSPLLPDNGNDISFLRFIELHAVVFLPRVILDEDECGVLLTIVNRITISKLCPDATLFTTNVKWSDPGSNRGLGMTWVYTIYFPALQYFSYVTTAQMGFRSPHRWGFYYYYYWYLALGPVWAETRVQSGDWYGSGTLHPGQILRGSLPLLSPAF